MTRSTQSSLAVPALVALVLAMQGCATAGRDTAIGAGAGGAAGAGVGYLVGGKKGALIGLGVGALAGGSVGLYLDKQRKELERVAEVKKTENGLLVQMRNDILFDTGSDAIKAEGVVELNKMADILAKYSDDRVKIEGHTDSVGDAKHNLTLSERRANAVKTILASRGVQEKQIEVYGFGETRPVADNGSAEGRVEEPPRRAAHRRAESLLTEVWRRRAPDRAGYALRSRSLPIRQPRVPGPRSTGLQPPRRRPPPAARLVSRRAPPRRRLADDRGTRIGEPGRRLRHERPPLGVAPEGATARISVGTIEMKNTNSATITSFQRVPW